MRSFRGFLACVGEKPSEHHTIDRINNSGHYSCGKCEECLEFGWVANCRWATRREQILNRTTTRQLEFNGVTKPLAKWADEFGLPWYTVKNRLNNGWDAERALTTPVNTAMGHSDRRNTDHSLRICWRSMLRRCGRWDAAAAFAGYVGVSVDDRWLVYENFAADMGPKPTPSHSIDRIDNSKGYGPDNCRWATPAEQGRNRRTARKNTAPPQ